MPTNLVTTPIAGTGNTPTATQSAPVISSDFETFLKMLTAQAQYQDPLEPIDSSQYASQLAQFSAVEQQVLSNDLLTALVGQMGTTNMAQLAGWVGMDARSAAPVSFDGSPVTLQASPLPIADQAFMVVRNAAGNEVQRSAIPVSTGLVEWAGVGDNGVRSHLASTVLRLKALLEANWCCQIPLRLTRVLSRHEITTTDKPN